MRLGYNTNGMVHHRLEDAIEILAEIGYQSIALTIDQHALNPYSAKRLTGCRQSPGARSALVVRCSSRPRCA